MSDFVVKDEKEAVGATTADEVPMSKRFRVTCSLRRDAGGHELHATATQEYTFTVTEADMDGIEAEFLAFIEKWAGLV